MLLESSRPTVFTLFLGVRLTFRVVDTLYKKGQFIEKRLLYPGEGGYSLIWAI